LTLTTQCLNLHPIIEELKYLKKKEYNQVVRENKQTGLPKKGGSV